MAKTIVTHVSPDFDGIPAIWLLKKFHPDFRDAKVAFVPVGEATYSNEPVDSNPNVLHVDTAMGKFDHHDRDEFTCGAKLVYEWLIREGYIKDDEALGRMVEIITQLDHGWDNYKWQEVDSDRYEFMLHNILVGWKILYPNQYEKYVEWTSHALDAVYTLMQQKVLAMEEIKGGKEFTTEWGKGVAVFTVNDAVLDLAIKSGYAVVVRKDPKRGFVRITGSNNFKVDFSKAYDDFKKADPDATWFLHASKVLLRNGSTRNPTMKPTRLELDEVVKILEKG